MKALNLGTPDSVLQEKSRLAEDCGVTEEDETGRQAGRRRGPDRGIFIFLCGRSAEPVALIKKEHGRYPSANVDAACIQGVCYIRPQDYNEAQVAFTRMTSVAFDSAPDYIFTECVLFRRVFRPRPKTRRTVTCLS